MQYSESPHICKSQIHLFIFLEVGGETFPKLFAEGGLIQCHILALSIGGWFRQPTCVPDTLK